MRLGRTNNTRVPLAVAIAFLVQTAAMAWSYDEIILLGQAEKKVFGQENSKDPLGDRLKALEMSALGHAGPGSDSQRLKAVCRKLGLLPDAPEASSGKEGKSTRAASQKRQLEHEAKENQQALAAAGTPENKSKKIGAKETKKTQTTRSPQTASPAHVATDIKSGETKPHIASRDHVQAEGKNGTKPAALKEATQQSSMQHGSSSLESNHETKESTSSSQRSQHSGNPSIKQPVPSQSDTSRTTPVTVSVARQDRSAPDSSDNRSLLALLLIAAGAVMAGGTAVVFLKGRGNDNESGSELESVDTESSVFQHKLRKLSTREPIQFPNRRYEPESADSTIRPESPNLPFPTAEDTTRRVARGSVEDAPEVVEDTTRRVARGPVEDAPEVVEDTTRRVARGPIAGAREIVEDVTSTVSASPITGESEVSASSSISRQAPLSKPKRQEQEVIPEASSTSGPAPTAQPKPQEQGVILEAPWTSRPAKAIPQELAPVQVQPAAEDAKPADGKGIEEMMTAPPSMSDSLSQLVSEACQTSRNLHNAGASTQQQPAAPPDPLPESEKSREASAITLTLAEVQDPSPLQDEAISALVPQEPYEQQDNAVVSPKMRTVSEFLSPSGLQPAVQFKVCPECGASYSLDADLCDDDKERLVISQLSPAITSSFGDRYEILSVIGSGGMSVVYRAVHKLLDKPVAIKLMDPHLVRNTAAVKRFQREAQMISRMNHPNIVVVHDFGITGDGQPYMVMDFIRGKNMAKTLASCGVMPHTRVKRILLQCASGLGLAHRNGIIHRDVKPNNIILDKDQDGDDLVKIVDFGIAKMSAEARDSNLTRAGELFGTTAYMSPEQCRGQVVDQRSDIFSLGCVLFEALTGHPPFEGEDLFDTLQMIVSAATPSVRERRPDAHLPFEFELIVNKCLEKDPEERYQTMSELIADLVKIQI